VVKEEVGMDRALTRGARYLALSGAAAVIFGLVAVFWPGLSLFALVALFGAFALVYGAMAFGFGLNLLAHRSTEWVPFVLAGAAGVAIGAVTFFRPGITALTLVYIIAGYALITGLFEVVAAIELRGQAEGTLWLGGAGVASVVFAVIAAIFPGSGALAIVWLIAIYAVVSGVARLVAAYRLHGFQMDAKQVVSAFKSATPQAQA
jgi:uncharacterized membrane protein HdeD (DUF308 family)